MIIKSRWISNGSTILRPRMRSWISQVASACPDCGEAQYRSRMARCWTGRLKGMWSIQKYPSYELYHDLNDIHNIYI